ncbi:MAG: hypothetical protein CSA15_04185 [Candidatus Delongbacteria bacterium]|nr:MAG: hypothetical protein CSA15_04185 [Candidatus Delongbacteria bacterium]
MESLTQKVYMESFDSKGKKRVSTTKLTYYLIGAVFTELYSKDLFQKISDKYTFKSFEKLGISYLDIIGDVVISLGKPRKFTSWIFKSGKKFSLLEGKVIESLKGGGFIDLKSSKKRIYKLKDIDSDKFTNFEKIYLENYISIVEKKGNNLKKNFIFSSAKYCIFRFNMTILLCFIGFVAFIILRGYLK